MTGGNLLFREDMQVLIENALLSDDSDEDVKRKLFVLWDALLDAKIEIRDLKSKLRELGEGT